MKARPLRADTDMGGLVHFSRFFVFMETAEHELLNALGATIHMTLEDGRTIGWPRVAASIFHRYAWVRRSTSTCGWRSKARSR